jgi:hypothetical protein
MAHDPNRTPGEDDEFFVGYFPSPPRTTRYALAIAAAMVLASAGVATAASYLQRPPGEATQREAAIDGLLVRAPYGMVRYFEGDRVRHALLVRGGKFGAPERDTERLGDRGVHVSGLLLERERGQMIELHAGITEAEVPDLERLRAVPVEELGEVTLRGEIVDSKCYLGRMRPGGGRTHRACAQLCIAGNIPPVLVAHDAQGRVAHYVLANEENGSIARDVLPFVAEPVEVTGRLSRVGDLRILAIRPDAIRRL